MNLIKGPNKDKWFEGNSKEIVRSSQGRQDGSIKGTNTIYFMHPRVLPASRKSTYLRVVVLYRPTKVDPFRIE